MSPTEFSPSAFANFGFAAVVCGFVLWRLDTTIRELRDAVRDQGAQMIAHTQRFTDAIKDNAAESSRLVDAINRSMVGRS